MLPRILLSLTVLITSVSLGADLPYPKDASIAPNIAAPKLTWTGCYVGGNIGGAWNRYQTIDQEPGLSNASFGKHTATGVIGGGQFGGDYQIENWVFGAQFLFERANLTGDNPNPIDPIQTVSNTVSWIAAGTGRVGYTVLPAALLYVRGGAAFMRESNLLSASIDSILVLTKTPGVTLSGWTAGIGLEYLFARNWSVFAEFNYIGIGTKRVTYTRNTDGQTFPFDLRNDVWEFHIGINYIFGARPAG